MILLDGPNIAKLIVGRYHPKSHGWCIRRINTNPPMNNVDLVYANDRAEEIMGQAIQELDWKHSDIIISTSCNDKGLSCKHIIEGTKASLKRLDMEYNMWMFSTVTGRIPLCRYGIRRIQF
ncbi:hypothetical protein JHK82_022727 [Glycine max]|nr:hypothetical protein JHK82_022727 [Glycine max]